MSGYPSVRCSYWLAVVALAAELVGCALPTKSTSMPTPRPLGMEVSRSSDVVFPGAQNTEKLTSTDENAPKIPDLLTLRATLALVLAYSPSLKGTALEVRAREAEGLQAGLFPNPEAGSTIENAAGSGHYSGFNSAETTIEISQLIELGGDRSSRVRLAAAETKLAGWDYEAQRLSVLTSATERFIDVLAAQNRLDLDEHLLGIAHQSQDAAAKRVDAGAASPIDRSRAGILVAQAISQVEQDRAELKVARRNLASLWGAGEATFQKAIGSFSEKVLTPPEAALEPYLADNPTVARWDDERESRLAALSLAKARAIPDITVGIGGRRFEDTGDYASIATLSVPLPLFDRNQGAISAARRRIDTATYDWQHAKDLLYADFVTAYGRLSAAAARLKSLNESILPKAQSVFDAVFTGYREGKFDLLSLLDAQRSLFETRLNVVEARADFEKAKTEIEGMVGRSLESTLDGRKGQERALHGRPQ